MIRAGFIGCGAIATEHLHALGQVDGIQPLAYCDTNPARAEQMLRQFGGAYATDNPEKIFADKAVDAVYICTWHDTHARLAIRAAESGKHIMMEKPMALTTHQCLAIGRAVEAAGVVLMTAFKLRYYPSVRAAGQFVQQPVMVIAQIADKLWPDTFWAQQPVIGGGNVASQGVHAFDLMCVLAGSEPVNIFARGGALTHPGNSVIDTTAATVRFANGCIGSVVVGDFGQAPYLSKFSFQTFDGLRSAHLYDRLKCLTTHDGQAESRQRWEQEEGMTGENRAFVEAIQTGDQPPSTWRHGLRATMMVQAAFESIRTGLPCDMPFSSDQLNAT